MMFMPLLSLSRTVALLRMTSFLAIFVGATVVCPANDFALPTDPLTHAVELSAAVDDQALNAIVPVSADRLVAVGDAGVILVSENAGRSWQQVRNGDPSNLNALAFLDASDLVAVGGSIGSFTFTSQATIIRSQDGGFTWQRLKTDLPRLTGMQNLNGRLIAWGDYSVKHRSALFVSVDRGATWTGVALRGVTHVKTVHQAANGETVIVDRNGKAFLRSPSGSILELKSLGDVEALHHTGKEWLALGRLGTLIQSDDGQTWRSVRLPLKEHERRLCDWSSIAQVGQHIWIGGFPGSVLLHSTDLGQTWNVESSSQRLPVSSISFLDESRGWFVGPLGSINATRNGSSWFAQRNQGRDLGVLCLTPDLNSVPWPALVGSSWDRGIASGVQVLPLSMTMAEPEFHPDAETCMADSFGKVGIVSSNAIPVRKEDNRLDVSYYKNRLHLMLQAWRPNIVIVANKASDTTWSMQATSLLDAARQNVRVEPSLETLAAIGQDDWKIEKVVQAVTLDQAHYSERSQRILKRLGLSIADVLLPLPASYDRSKASGLMTTWSASRNQAARDEFLGACSFGNSSLRRFASDELGNFQLVMGRVHLRNSIARLSDLETSHSDWLQNLELILQSLPQKDAVPTLLSLATQLGEQGKHERQHIVFERIIANFPKTDAARFVMLKSLELAASDEHAAWRQKELKRQARANEVSFATSSAPEVSTTAWSGSPFDVSQGATGAVVAASSTNAPKNVLPDPVAWFQALAAYNQLLPNLDARPDVKLGSYQMACKLNGRSADNLQKLESLISASELPNWSNAAVQELRNASNSLGLDDLVGMVVWTDERPNLDGHLNESFWGTIPPMKLRPLVGADSQVKLAENEASIRWAYDEQYLYLGIVCEQAAAASEVSAAEPQRVREYDSDLSKTDHLEIVIDVDRDYSSAIQLGIAKDGRTYDRCCGNQAFNPKWHVIVKQSENQWVAEIAIPADYLTTQEYLVGKSWAVSARRRSGATNVASWQHGSSQDVELRDNGLLLFLPNE